MTVVYRIILLINLKMRLSKHVLIVLITVFSLALSISNPWNRLGVKAYFSMEEIQKAYEIKTEKYKDNPNKLNGIKEAYDMIIAKVLKVRSYDVESEHQNIYDLLRILTILYILVRIQSYVLLAFYLSCKFISLLSLKSIIFLQVYDHFLEDYLPLEGNYRLLFMAFCPSFIDSSYEYLKDWITGTEKLNDSEHDEDNPDQTSSKNENEIE